MARSPRPRKSASLSDSLHRQINMYALAASAAGVGMLAFAQPVDAEIVYIPTHRHIALGHLASLDLNRDGIANFTISVSRFQTEHSQMFTALGVIGARQGNSIAGYYSNTTFHNSITLALKAGQEIGPALSFVGPYGHVEGAEMILASATRKECLRGQWKNVRDRYLGLKFRIKKGPTQYGWARLNASCSSEGGVSALLTGFAYETVPNKPIIAGRTKEPVPAAYPLGLGGLARGSATPAK